MTNALNRLSIEEWLKDSEYWMCGAGTTISGAKTLGVVKYLMRDNARLRKILEEIAEGKMKHGQPITYLKVASCMARKALSNTESTDNE